MVQKAASLYEQGKNCGSESNMAKYLGKLARRVKESAAAPEQAFSLFPSAAAEASWMAGEAAMQTFGGFAFAEEYDIERKWRETRLYQIAPISTNMVLAYLSQHVLGLPRSY